MASEQKRALAREPFMDISYSLFHQHHFASFAMVVGAEAIEIDTGGNGVAVLIGAIPYQGVSSGRSIAVEEALHQLSFHVEDIQLGIAIYRHIEADGGFGVEGVREVLVQNAGYGRSGLVVV